MNRHHSPNHPVRHLLWLLALTTLLSSCRHQEGMRGCYELQEASIEIDGTQFPMGDIVGDDLTLKFYFHNKSLIGIKDNNDSDIHMGRYHMDGKHLFISFEGYVDTMRFNLLKSTDDTLIIENVVPEVLLLQYMRDPVDKILTAHDPNAMDNQVRNHNVGSYSNAWSQNWNSESNDSTQPEIAEMKMQAFRAAVHAHAVEGMSDDPQRKEVFDTLFDENSNIRLKLVMTHKRK